MSNFRHILAQSTAMIARRPILWMSMLVVPLFCFVMITGLMGEGLPVKVPAAIVDMDQSSMSRQVTRTLGGMQMVDVADDCNSFTEARHSMQEGRVYGFFIIPRGYEQDLLAGRAPEITFYTNMTYYVPASLLFKTFTATALYTKAGTVMKVMNTAGVPQSMVMPMLQPVSVQVRGLGNPWLNYGVYLCNSFLPGVLQLMILLVTCFTLGEDIKYGRTERLLRQCDGSIVKTLAARLLPQTMVWMAVALFMESWLFCWNGYPMHGSWWWMTLSELMFVLACQGLGIFIMGIMPNLRLGLSIASLIGILSFSLCAFSFPVQSMYGAIAIFSGITPVRYNFLIYIDQALNGIPVYYSRYWFVAYLVFMLLPFTVLWRLKRNFQHPVYVP